MEGGTTFIFVTDGIEAALHQAKQAVDGRDVKIGGGVATVRQYLRAGLVDELHFALSPVVLGQGEAMFVGIDLPALGYRVTEHRLNACESASLGSGRKREQKQAVGRSRGGRNTKIHALADAKPRTLTRRLRGCTENRLSDSSPVLFRFSLHCWCLRIFDLDPVHGATGAVW